ncbi:hypothetical protein PB2503_13034 [Parvularcula bermudensis HTCC2503]|uniref:N-terminal double-transmembrane domain protein n=1 Tax=Parvularcula bermudensis (strain ATCC BAA-594 / HTCC2503 / KCTC 12087) TaxID=314260 RepID=E0TG73_PARBH|nr:DUF4159 domain-containing protein [Parvularcula bermudensis]ADM10644.1 hypothetical protein PB2503_13034 [Parvularcula bermudensis HTCC2503]
MTGLSFAAPWLLLALLGLPLLWWLLKATPPPPTRTPFGGTVFLKGLRATKDTPAATPLWLLLIRLFVLALLIIGLAGPIWGARDTLAGQKPLLIVLDDTWPAAPGWRQRQETVRALALDPEAAGRTVRLLRTAGEASLSDPMRFDRAADDIAGIVPQAGNADRAGALPLMEGATSILWISDGVIGRSGADASFLQRIARTEEVYLLRPGPAGALALRGMTAESEGLRLTVERIGDHWSEADLRVIGREGQRLAETTVRFDANARQATGKIRLPLALQNEVIRAEIGGVTSAGATWLADAGSRRVRAGVVSDGDETLLDGGFYLQSALEEAAVVATAPLADLLNAETGMIILDDIGTIRPDLTQRVSQWVEAGGVLVRFAGPNTANTSTHQRRDLPPLLPLPLIAGERALGGALSWTSPQTLAPFPQNSPFAGLDLSGAPVVRRQVLANPNALDQAEIWASLTDETPLVTARRQGDGVIVLFHVTATPTWSDLPLSGVFPAVFGRLADLAAGTLEVEAAATLPPYLLLDGFGRLRPPGDRAEALRSAPRDAQARRPAPGLYGDARAARAVNTYPEGAAQLDPLTGVRTPANVTYLATEGTAGRSGPALITAALVLLLIDALAGGLLHRRTIGTAALVVLAAILFPVMTNEAAAQTRRPPIDPAAATATLKVRFGYVETGDAATDRLSRQGLTGLATEAYRRSALEPAPPMAIDIESDDLSVFPLIYWPIRPDIPPPSDAALAALESFMAGGGLLLIDTMDGEQQTDASLTAAGDALRSILLRMNVPPLEPLPEGHILTKSFYRLDDLHGRNSGGEVWIESDSALRESTDGVPSLIIGGRDWAAAWAIDDRGQPVRSPGRGGERRREYAFRAGINIAMVALTGNYKGDQVHVQSLLDEMGETR